MSETVTIEEATDANEDSKIQSIVVHLQQLLLAENVLPSTKTSSGTSDPHFQNSNRNAGHISSDDYLDQLAPIIRDALTNNQTDELRSGIDTITKSKDQEIENLCNGNQNVRADSCFLWFWLSLNLTLFRNM